VHTVLKSFNAFVTLVQGEEEWLKEL